MSISLNKAHILFLIFLLKSLNFAKAAPIYYNDYNSFDLNDTNSKDYWENDETNTNEPPSNGDFQTCKPIKQTTTTISPPAAIPCSRSTTEPPMAEEYQDIVEHIMKILRSMRSHVLALMRNMNQLEMDILSSPSSDLEQIYKNSTNALSETVNGMDKIFYPDVLSQIPGYVTNEWSIPMKVNSIPDSDQTNEFVAEAQEAVKSWKQQIENCKTILDNAVHHALRQANLKSNVISDPMARENLKAVESNKVHPSSTLSNNLSRARIRLKQLSRDLMNQQEKIQRSRSDQKYKYHSLYDAFRTKEEDY